MHARLEMLKPHLLAGNLTMGVYLVLVVWENQYISGFIGERRYNYTFNLNWLRLLTIKLEYLTLNFFHFS